MSVVMKMIICFHYILKCSTAFLLFHAAGMVTPNCTFDSDLCGWTHVEILPPLMNNTWVRWRGETVNYHSGPVTDHTIKTFEGKSLVNIFG